LQSSPNYLLIMINLNFKYMFLDACRASQNGRLVCLDDGKQKCYDIDFSHVDHLVIEAIEKLDGTQTINSIVENLPKECADSFLSFVNQLLSLNLIKISDQDAIQTVVNQWPRFDRQIRLFNHLQGNLSDAVITQKTISQSKVSLIGLGGIGSYVFYTLSAMGVGFLKCFDYDVVEESNLSRQILYDYSHIGKSKVEVAKEKSSQISPTTHYQFFNKKIDTIDDCRFCCEDVDLIIVAADNPTPQLMLNCTQAAFQLNVPILHGGSYTNNILIGPLLIPGETCCLNCFYNIPGSHIFEDQFNFVKKINCNQVSTLIDPYNGIGGSMIALEAIKFLTSFDQCAVLEKVMMQNLSSYETTYLTASCSKKCKICSVVN